MHMVDRDSSLTPGQDMFSVIMNEASGTAEPGGGSSPPPLPPIILGVVFTIANLQFIPELLKTSVRDCCTREID